jgi:DNA-binding CsgD family transcriptional regulator
MNSVKGVFTKIFSSHDELSFRNIRFASGKHASGKQGSLWAAILVFPISVILGDIRYFNLRIEYLGLQSYELMLFPLGLGWLVLFFLPKQFILPALRISASLCAALLPFQLLLTEDVPRLYVFMAFQFLNGICAGAAFYIFCFTLNNVERLFGMMLITFYYGYYHVFYRAFPAVQTAQKTWVSVAVMAFYLLIVFLCFTKKEQAANRQTENTNNNFSSTVMLVIALDIVYYLFMATINYTEGEDNQVNTLAWGLGQFASIVVVFIIHLWVNRSALYSWLIFLVLSLLGLGALIPNNPVLSFAGSFSYGLGDGIGYIIIYFICGGVIKQSKSLKMFRLYCLVFFVEYFILSGLLAKSYENFVGQSHLLAFGIVIILASICFMFLPVLQRRVFDAPWSDGLHMVDMIEYAPALAETEQLDASENLGLSPREKEIFTLLLTDVPRKQIAHTLKISYSAVNFHVKNIYKKFGIQSRVELLTKFGKPE